MKNWIKTDQLFYPIFLYLGWRIVIFSFQIFLQPLFIITPDSESIYQRIYLSWIEYWDGGHYLGIAKLGYHYPQQAFFPLWPLLIKFTTIINALAYPLITSLIFFLGLTSFVLFYKLANKLFGETAAKFSLLIFCCFPSAMFLIANYTENLFVNLVLISFLFIENKRYFLASIFGALASATKIIGVSIALIFLFLKQSISIRIKLFLLSLTGLILYMIYLGLEYNDIFFFLAAQKEWCQTSSHCGITNPITPLINYGELVVLGWVKPNLSPLFTDWFTSTIFLFLSFFVWKKLGLNYFIYTISVIILPLSSGSTTSMVRYCLVALPIFIILPKIIPNKIILSIIIIILFLLQLRFVSLFTSRMWVA